MSVPLVGDTCLAQAAVDAYALLVLPKGVYRLSRTLTLRKPGHALVGVGAPIHAVVWPDESRGAQRGFQPCRNLSTAWRRRR